MFEGLDLLLSTGRRGGERSQNNRKRACCDAVWYMGADGKESKRLWVTSVNDLLRGEAKFLKPCVHIDDAA